MGRSAFAVHRLVLVAVLVAVAVSGAGIAAASVRDSAILNQTVFRDATADSGVGVDLSSLTVTTFSDGTASFAVQFANRDFLHPHETVQLFIDLNDDGHADLNLSIWPTHEPSYLDRWSGK